MGTNKVASFDSYASPRTWTFLSDAVKSIYGENPRVSEYKNFVLTVGSSYVGASASRFVKYLDEMSNISVNDIVEKFSTVKKDVQKFNRDRKSEILNELKKFEVKELNKKQLSNIGGFVKLLDEDEQVGYLNFLIDEDKQISEVDIKSNAKIKEFLRPFKDIFKKVAGFC